MITCVNLGPAIAMMEGLSKKIPAALEQTAGEVAHWGPALKEDAMTIIGASAPAPFFTIATITNGFAARMALSKPGVDLIADYAAAAMVLDINAGQMAGYHRRTAPTEPTFEIVNGQTVEIPPHAFPGPEPVRPLGATKRAARDLLDKVIAEAEGKVKEFQEMVEDWVAEEKKRDYRDVHASDEDIAGFIRSALLDPNDKREVKRYDSMGRKQKHAGELVRDVFMPRIADYLPKWLERKAESGKRVGESGKQKAESGNGPVSDDWMAMVLASWKTLVGTTFVERFYQKLK